MDIGGGNLEALAEEDAENENWDVESEDSDDGLDGGIRAQEPNKFDSLCDGVLNAMALVHAALSEFLEFKDEILLHSLPPNVLLRMGLVSGKVFRSVSDLHMPMNELIRMVRVYSTPWEEKSAALKKLHEDYENKQRQLGIAVRRLQMIDTNAKRNAKERRIMNWEKLFAKMTSAKGHGRRWKFMIKTFKDKAKDGFEYVKEYVDGLSDDEGESEDENLLEDLETTHGDKNVQVLDMNALSDTSSFHSDEEAEAEAVSIAGSRDIQSGSSHKRVHFDEEAGPEMIMIEKPEMADKGTWTNEPEYDRCLNVKVHKPQGLDVRDIKCVITYGKKYFKTNNLDIRVDIEELKKTMVKPVEKDSPVPKKGGRLIGTRGKTHGIAAMKAERDKEIQDRDAERQRLEEEKRRLEERGLSEDFEFNVADELPEGVSDDLALPVDPLRIAVHHGNKEEIIAMATIELEDLESCDLPVYYKDHPVGDDPFPEDPGQKSSVSFAEDSELDDELRSETSSTSGRPRVDPDGVHLKFPLYTVKGRGDAAHQPVGQLPLTLKWGKTLRPKTFNRTSETMTVNELVLDLTGVDLDITSKEDIMKPPAEKTERALSAIDIPVPTPTPEPVEEVEETVLKSEYDEMVGKYDQQMQLLQEEYESRLQELAESIDSMQQQAQDVLFQESTKTPESIHGRHSSQFSRSPSAPFKPVRIRRVPQPPSEPVQQGNRKNFKIGRPLPKWGETLPSDFFERLKLFSEESELHRQEIAEKRQQEVYGDNEKKLTAEFKIAKPGEEEYNEMQDVTLPALFMPMRNGAGVYNPRAHQYFQASGSTGVRLTQPPSMMMLPPIPNNKLSVVNLFDISNNFNRSGSDWLMQRFVNDQGGRKDGTPHTPAPTVAGKRANLAKSAEVVIGERSIEMKPVPPLQEVEKGPSR